MGLGLYSKCAYLLAFLVLSSAASGEAKVFYAKLEALDVAFPSANGIETKSYFLTADQVKQVEALAEAPVDSKLATFYVGKKNGEVLGYAFIETHTVRSLPEAFLIVVSPEGRIQKLLILAFYEPQDYLPPARWLQQFEQKALSPGLQLNQEIHGIMGATLSARAVTRGTRKVLALFQVLIQAKG